MSIFSALFKRNQELSLERRVADLEKRWQEVDVEWCEWFTKFRLLYARLAKKVKEVVENEAADGTLHANGNLPAVPGPPLSPRARLIQEQIEAARARRGE